MCIYPCVCESKKIGICVCILVYASGPKTVLVKSTFLGSPTKRVFGPLARLGWGGVGWGGVGCDNVLSFAFFL